MIDHSLLDPSPSLNQFWDVFCENHWHNAPILLRGILDQPLATDQEIVGMLAGVSRDFIEAKPAMLAVYIDGARKAADYEAILPTDIDCSLSDYAERLDSALGRHEFMLTAYSVQYYNRAVWTRVKQFLQGLFVRVGIPGHYIDLNVFAGCYSGTPTGIHRDAAANLTYVVTGRKKYVFWPSNYFENLPRGRAAQLGTSDFQSHLEGAIVIEAERGDVVYWPASYWHIAVSPDASRSEWSATLNIALYGNRSSRRFVSEAVVNAERMCESGAPWCTSDSIEFDPNDVNALPTPVADEFQAFVSLVQSPDLKTKFHEVWARHLSAYGFSVVPPPSGARHLEKNTRISRSTTSPLILVPNGSEKAKVFANGHAINIPSHLAFSAMVQLLNSMKAYTVEELIQAVRLSCGDVALDGNGGSGALIETLEALDAVGALTVYDS